MATLIYEMSQDESEVWAENIHRDDRLNILAIAWKVGATEIRSHLGVTVSSHGGNPSPWVSGQGRVIRQTPVGAPMATDDRRIKTRDASALTLDDFRHLAKWCDNQWAMWFVGRNIGQILAMYHAANDAGYAGMDEWNSDAPDAASDAWDAIATTGNTP